MGGLRPDPVARRTAGAPASFGFAGGAPEISSEWLHEGDRTLIVLTNLDPNATKAAIVPLRAVVQRMSPAGLTPQGSTTSRRPTARPRDSRRVK